MGLHSSVGRALQSKRRDHGPVFPQFKSTSIHVSFLLRIEMNSINCSTTNTWVFIAKLVEHYSANAETMAGWNPVKALTIFFGPKFAIA